MIEFSIAFSPCPNDTFIFHAMLHNCIDTGDHAFSPHIDDVEALNNAAFKKTFQITKLSFYAYLLLKEDYELLDSGSALGFGCGPLLVTRKESRFSADSRIAIPGNYTTAFLLLKLWNPEIRNIVVTRFDRILPGVQSGEYDAGLIIHEGRFIYPDYGCEKVIDLGEWWEKETNLPIPLGCIAIRKDPETIVHKEQIELLIKNSVIYAKKNRNASRSFVRKHAQELDDKVIDGHIDLYVNDFTVSLGITGKKAVQTLEERARWEKIL
ncbi:MAG: 1,4-dihydroxy-6-naphthoate synthase [Desulfobacterales bacterium]|jgi:1,4-dihydroxy-6-naphthoate synthase|nr:1,4-dihydroxy-6-naphthoate synthase [Desulfobacterales bacterium]